MTSSSPVKRRRQPIQGTSSSVDHLPEELTELILLKCPLKSVVRFKSVSKSWQSLISDPRFSKTHHIERSKVPENENKFLIFASPENCYDHNQLYLIGLKDGKFEREAWWGNPPEKFILPVCSCDGLILIQMRFGEYALWNPFIKKHIIIPKLKSKSYLPWYNAHDHLYYDPVSEDYKIVCFYRDWYAVYSCKSGNWGETRDFDRDRIGGEVASIDGYIYGMQRDGEGGILSIMCFDVREGKLYEFLKPEGAECLDQVQNLLLHVVSGRLCLYGFTEGVGGGGIQLWVMEENKCWRKLISRGRGRGRGRKERMLLDAYYLTIPVCLSNQDHVVLSAQKPGKSEHFIYNSRQKRLQKSNFTWKLSHNYFPYQENLYLL